MITTFETALGQSVKMTELYDYLGLTKDKYSRFIKKELLKSPYFEMNKDYLPDMASNKKEGERGQFRQEINVHIDCAKKICMVSKSKKGNEIRDELVKLTNDIADGKYMKVADGKIAFEFASYYRYVPNQKMTKDEYIQQIANRILFNHPNLNRNHAFALATKERNKMLNTSKDQIFQEYVKFCIENGFTPKKDLSIAEMTFKFDKYLLIYFAVMDFLLIKGYPKPESVAGVVYQVCKMWDIEILPENETNLFERKQPVTIKSIENISNKELNQLSQNPKQLPQ